MSAVLVIRALLLVNPKVVELLGEDIEDRIVAGTVPQGVLPAMGITEISRIELPTVSGRAATALVRARVQVTVHAKYYPAKNALLLAAKLGGSVHTGDVAGVRVRSILRLEVGPDLSDDDADLYSQSRDFMVAYIERNE